MIRFRILGSALASVLLLTTATYAQSFTCPLGTDARCLDYGDKVCSSRGKCVSSSAECFEPYQCNFEGFTCKSNLTELAKKYDGLVVEYSSLLRRSKALASDYDDLIGRYRDQSYELETAQSELNDAKEELEKLRQCVSFSNTLDEARDCRP